MREPEALQLGASLDGTASAGDEHQAISFGEGPQRVRRLVFNQRKYPFLALGQEFRL